jgi:hypothetical protein
VEDAFMSRQAVGMLLDNSTADAGCRTAMRNDPEAAVRAINVELDRDEWLALRAAVDWTVPDEEVRTRLSAS